MIPDSRNMVHTITQEKAVGYFLNCKEIIPFLDSSYKHAGMTSIVSSGFRGGKSYNFYKSKLGDFEMKWTKEETGRVSFTTDGRGKISCGGKDENGMYKYPYFVVKAYPEIVAAYGTEEPEFLLIELENSAGLEDVIQMDYMEFKQGGLKRRCDRVEMMIFGDNMVDMVEGRKVAREKYSKHKCVYPACECRMKITIYCHVVDPETMMPITKLVRIQNGSLQTKANIQTMMKSAMGLSPTPELEEKLVKSFIWRVNVVMKKQKIGKGPTFEIEAVGWKRTRTAHNLLEAAGMDDPGVSVKMISSGEQKPEVRSQKSVENLEEQKQKKQEQIDKDMSFTMDDVFGVQRDENGKVVKAGDYAEFEEISNGKVETSNLKNGEQLNADKNGSEPISTDKNSGKEQETKNERRDSFWLIKMLNRDLSEVEFRDLLLDFNELNRANGIGLMELKQIKELIREKEEQFRVQSSEFRIKEQKDKEFESPNSNKAGTGAGISSQSPASEVPAKESSSGTSSSPDESGFREERSTGKNLEHTGFSDSSLKVLKKVEECKTMEEWLVCLTLYNALRVKADEKKKVYEILFKKKETI
jgi:hypothetical protein